MKVEEIKNWYLKKEKLYFASIELTQNCNFKCNHCYCANKNSEVLSFEDFVKIIDKLSNTSCLFLNFTGGEIFSYPKFKEIYRYAKNKGFIIDLLTNISLLNQEIIDLFKEYPPNNIAISIYGTNEEEYEEFTGNKENYKKVLNALNILKKNNISFVLRTVTAKTYKNSLLEGEFDKLANKFGTILKYDTTIFPKTSGERTPLNECLKINEIIEFDKKNLLRKNAWKNLIEKFKTKKFFWTCNAGINSMAIDYKGNAYVCGLYRNNPISVLDNDIEMVQKHLKKIHKRHMDLVENNECSKCKYRKICKWCPAYSFIYNKIENKKIDFFCKLSEARLREFGK